MDQFRSQFTWQYKVSDAGQIPIHDHHYGIGTVDAGKTMDVRFDATTREFIFSDAQTACKVKRHPAFDLDTETRTATLTATRTITPTATATRTATLFPPTPTRTPTPK